MLALSFVAQAFAGDLILEGGGLVFNDVGGKIVLDRKGLEGLLEKPDGALLTRAEAMEQNLEKVESGLSLVSRNENGGGRIVFTKTWQDYSVASSTDNDLDFLVIEQACRYQDCIVQLDTHLVWGGNNPNGYFSLQESTDKSTWRQLRVLSLRDEPEANLEDEESEMSTAFFSPGHTNVHYYKLWFHHDGRNGGTMRRNINFNQNQEMCRNKQCGQTAITFTELKPRAN